MDLKENKYPSMLMNKEEDSKDLRDLKKEIKYDKVTGDLFWTVPFANRNLSKPIGSNNDRYKVLIFRQKRYHLHKIVWYLFNGYYPVKGQIDHVNQNTKDNRIENLRYVSSFENSRNKPLRRDNKLGIVGVFFENYTQKYRASIVDNKGKLVRSKRFDSICEAIFWRIVKEKEYGYSINHGRQKSLLPYRRK